MVQQRLLPAAGFSGRPDPVCARPLPAGPAGARSVASPGHRGSRHQLCAQAGADSTQGFGAAVRNVARQVQGALPIVGLLSRLTSSDGGIGRDEFAYPEFARQLINKADPAFEEAAGTWEERYGRVGQRKYVVLFLWMAYTGLGLVPRKAIANAAMRLRITHDLPAEMERFEGEREKALSVYTYAARPQGKAREQIAVAVDALCRLSIGLKDGQPIPQQDQGPLAAMVARTFWETEGAEQLAQEAVSDSARAARATANQ